MNVLVVAGAGASKHLGYPTSEELSDRIWDAVANALGLKAGGQREGAPSGTEGPAMLPEEQPNSLASARDDFELLWDILDHAAGRERQWAARAKAVFMDTLLEAFSKRPAPDSLRAGPWGRLFAQRPQRRDGCKVAVFTTNYDPVFDALADALGDDGPFRLWLPYRLMVSEPAHRVVEPQPVRSGETLFGPSHADADVPVFPLHGSVFWREEGEGDVRREHQVPKPQEAGLVWPGRGKVLLREPYSRFYARLWEAARSADRIVIIGHSLGDPALAYALSAAPIAGHRRGQGKQPELLVVDRDAKVARRATRLFPWADPGRCWVWEHRFGEWARAEEKRSDALAHGVMARPRGRDGWKLLSDLGPPPE